MSGRLREVGWVLEHQRDLEADFRAFYHLSPAESLALPGPEFLSLAWRAPAFSGVMAARIEAEREQETTDRQEWGRPTGTTVRDVPLGAGLVPPDADGLPLTDLFDFAS